MAIKDMKGTVVKDKATMTGMMNTSPKKIDTPNLSGMEKLFGTQKKDTQVAKAPAPVEEKSAPVESNLGERLQNLPDEDKAVLSAVLSPSVSNALAKIVPELAPLAEAAGSKEENVIIPVSMFKNFATKRYSGDERQAVESFVTDLSGDMMGQQTVPPDMAMAETPESGFEEEFERIDEARDDIAGEDIA